MKKSHIVMAGLALCPTATVLADNTRQESPNVLILYSDDHGYNDFSFLNPEVKTPNLDKLAENSVVFKNSYATAPISSPARCGIMTGQYQQRFGNKWFGGDALSNDVKTMAEYFEEEGYETGYFGKLHYGRRNERSLPHNHGFKESLTTSYGGRTHYLYHSEDAVERYGKEAHGEIRMNVRPMLQNGEFVDKDGFTTEILSKACTDFIDQAINEGKPFFSMLAFNAVHNFAWQLPKEYLEEWGLPEHPDWSPELGRYEDWYQNQIYPNFDLGRAYYIAQLYYMDREIGRIIDYLKEKGVYENTIIVYSTDNGGSTCNYADNTPLRATKYTLYEGGIRVPLFISWKGKIKPGENINMVSSMDIMPTLLSAINSKAEYEIDGINLLPHINSDKKIQRDTLFWDVNWQYAVRKGDWKLKVTTSPGMSAYTRDYEHAEPGFGTELFNLADDPYETTNLAKKNRKLVRELKKEYRKWKKEIR